SLPHPSATLFPYTTLFRSLHAELQELVSDGLVDQRAGRAGADFSLVQGKHREALESLVEELVLLVHDIREEQGWGFAAQLQGDGDNPLGCDLVDDAANLGGTSERDLGDALGTGQSGTCLRTEAIDDVQDAIRQQVCDLFDQVQQGGRGLLCRLQDDGVTGSQRWCDLPGSHEDREVPGDDLTHDAQWLVEVVGDGVVVDLGEPALLGT